MTPDDLLTYAQIDLAALKNNYHFVTSLAGKSRVMAMVKADAYGHGLVPVAQALSEAGVEHFGVAFLEEGLALRSAGIKGTILVIGGLPEKQIPFFLEQDLDITLSSEEKLNQLEVVCASLGKRAKVQIKVDTGMSRIGVRPSSARRLIDRAVKSKYLTITGIYSHLALADQKDSSFTRLQLEHFSDVINYLDQIDYDGTYLRHIANSAALINYPESRLDLVRSGIFLYGCSPANDWRIPELQPVMSVYSKVVYFKTIDANVGVSYGLSWKSSEQTRILTIPVGYGHGYPRILSNRSRVLVRHQSCPVVGNICMDQMMINLGKGEAYTGDLVTLLGGEKNPILAEELAQLAGTVSYEILTGFNSRIPRVYVK